MKHIWKSRQLLRSWFLSSTLFEAGSLISVELYLGQLAHQLLGSAHALPPLYPRVVGLQMGATMQAACCLWSSGLLVKSFYLLSHLVSLPPFWGWCKDQT